VKRDLKDWCITKELALDRRERKLAIHVPEPWSSVPSFYCLLLSFFPRPFFAFWLSVLLPFLLFFIWFFYRPLFSSSFSLLFCTCFFFAYVVSSLAYPNLLGNKRLGCCCCCCHVQFSWRIWTNVMFPGENIWTPARIDFSINHINHADFIPTKAHFFWFV
jgi:hypothetical protein